MKIIMSNTKIDKKPTRAELKKLKIDSIFTSAMTLLKQGGIESLSMRAIAENVGMSLSNLQYHFKTRDDLLVSLLGNFLNEYILESKLNDNEKTKENSELDVIYHQLLTHESMDRCALVFKEIWAYSHRSDRMNVALSNYYMKLHELLCDILSLWSADARISHKNIVRCVDIILPFFEGYCITKSTFQRDPKELSKDLKDISSKILFE